jgi:hypothetical protein
MEVKTTRIRKLNDELRKSLTGGQVLLTPGIAALGPESVERVIKAITIFDDFCNENDPYTEHDFGSLDVEGQKVFFKIDYYNRDFSAHSPDPSDPAVTSRVITLMLASEY